MGANESDRQESRKPMGDQHCVACWRHRDVDCRCNFYASARDPHGRDEFAAGDLDWGMPDSFGGFSWNIALNVHHRGRTNRRNVAPRRARVFIFSFDADDGRRHLLRFVQNTEAEPRHD